MAAQSQLIRNRDTQKTCFGGSFLEKILVLTNFDQRRPPLNIHRWKAMDLSFLMVFLKKYFMDPAKRQIFRDASGQIFSLILRPCHIVAGDKMNSSRYHFLSFFTITYYTIKILNY